MEENGTNTGVELSTASQIQIEEVEGTEKIQSTQKVEDKKEDNVSDTCEAKGVKETDEVQRTEEKGGKPSQEEPVIAIQKGKEDTEEEEKKETEQIGKEEDTEETGKGDTEEMRKKGEHVHQPGQLNNDEEAITEEENTKIQRMQVRRDNMYHNLMSSFEEKVREIEAYNTRNSTIFEVDKKQIDQLKLSYTSVHEDQENYQKIVNCATDNKEKQEELVGVWDTYLKNWETMAKKEDQKYRALQEKLARAKERQSPRRVNATTLPVHNTTQQHAAHLNNETKRTYANHATQPALAPTTTRHTTQAVRTTTTQPAQHVQPAQLGTTPRPTPHTQPTLSTSRRTVKPKSSTQQVLLPPPPAIPTSPAVKLYVLQEDFKDIGPQLEKLLKPLLNCQVVEWKEEEAAKETLLLHCVVVDTRLDHIALPVRVKQLLNKWGKNNYIFLRVHNQTSVTYENDDVNLLLEGAQVWKSKYKVKVNMSVAQSYAKEFIDSENITPSLVKLLKNYI